MALFIILKLFIYLFYFCGECFIALGYKDQNLIGNKFSFVIYIDKMEIKGIIL